MVLDCGYLLQKDDDLYYGVCKREAWKKEFLLKRTYTAEGCGSMRLGYQCRHVSMAT